MLCSSAIGKRQAWVACAQASHHYVTPFPHPCHPLQAFQQMLKDIIARSLDIKVDQTTLDYVTKMTTLLFNSKNYDFDEWADAMVPYLTAFLSQDGAESVCRTYLGK